MNPLSMFGGGLSASSGASGSDSQESADQFTGGSINTGFQFGENNPFLIGGIILAAVVAVAIVVK